MVTYDSFWEETALVVRITRSRARGEVGQMSFRGQVDVQWQQHWKLGSAK